MIILLCQLTFNCRKKLQISILYFCTEQPLYPCVISDSAIAWTSASIQWRLTANARRTANRQTIDVEAKTLNTCHQLISHGARVFGANSEFKMQMFICIHTRAPLEELLRTHGMHHAFKLHARARAQVMRVNSNLHAYLWHAITLCLLSIWTDPCSISLSLAGSFAHPHTPQRRALSQGPEAQINYYLAAAISLVTMRVTANFTIVEQHKGVPVNFLRCWNKKQMT
jgi:hypothetical protein